ncbi:MAG: hypothetical protein AAGI72_23485 [Pseudomonadota bacterium]
MAIIRRQEPDPVSVEWTEGRIGSLLNTHLFRRDYLVVVPNCHFASYEADLLAVSKNLRLVDVEIKISRSDLKADAKKGKWQGGDRWEFCDQEKRHVRAGTWSTDWPPRIWKHYYAMPAEIWKDELFECLPSEKSGVLLLRHDGMHFICRVHRPAKPQRNAATLTNEEVVNVARLASLRMWSVIEKREPAPPAKEEAEADDWAI